MNNEGAGYHGPSGRGGGRKHGISRLDVYFSNAPLPGGSNCVRQTSHIFTDIKRACHQTLRRIYAGTQITPSFCTRAPEVQKLSFSSEIEGFSCGNYVPQAESFCRACMEVRSRVS